MELSVLLITASPDQRRSTHDLEMVAQALGRRSDARVGLWYLRHGDRSPVEDSWTVDELRTWQPAATLDRLGARLPAGLLRGRRLRRRLRALDPDVVVLDDGLGARVLDQSTHPLVLNRVNAVGPAMYVSEAVCSTYDGVVDSDPWGPFCGDKPVLELGSMREPGRSNDEEVMSLVGRRALGLPQDVHVVAGLASELSPDALIEVLQHNRMIRGHEVHGLWLDPCGSPADCSAARASALKGGVSGVFHVRQVDLPDVLPVADVVLLDCESAASRVQHGLDPAMVVPYGSNGSGRVESNLAVHQLVLARLEAMGRHPKRMLQGEDPDEWAGSFIAFVGQMTRGNRP